MEANYSNYDRSQIKLKFKVLIGLKDFFFFFFTSCFPRKEKKEGTEGSEAVKTCWLGLAKGKSYPFLKGGGGREKKKEKQK